MSAEEKESFDPRLVLGHYDLGDTVEVLGNAGGTAGRTWKVAAPTGQFLLRLRGIRTSTQSRLVYDHGLRAHLMARGIPTVLPIPTRSGGTWLQVDGRVYELYPFVCGEPFTPGDERAVASAAQALARFHQAAVDYRPSAGDSHELVDQYSILGFANEVSDRVHDPRLMLANLRALRALAPNADDQRLMDRCLSRIAYLIRTYSGAPYRRLAGWVVHGDFTPANLLFSPDGEVVGIFDFDWALTGARCQDIAEAMYFFASEPRGINSSDIWSLTDAAQFDLGLCVLFLQAYQAVSVLTSVELDAIPAAFAAMWLSVRLEGMAKVPQSDRFRFFAREIEKPLIWMDQNWAYLRRSIRRDDL